MVRILRLLCLFASLGHAVGEEDQAVVMVVDPIWDDVASFVAHYPKLKDYKMVKVMTRPGKSHSFAGGTCEVYKRFAASSNADPIKSANEICPQLKALGMKIAAIIPTSDGVVSVTDLLAACVGVRGNPAFGPLALARRDKWIMGESVKAAGLRTIREKVASSWAEAEAYLKTWDPPLSKTVPCVFKVLTGAGGEGVIQVYSLEGAKAKWEEIQHTHAQFGGSYTKILLQEYLNGVEYAVDSVSRDGVHKVVAVWIEDFRPANGIFDQYFGFKLMDPKEPQVQAVIAYGNAVLKATGKMVGAANTEIKWLPDEDRPCLVEINDRWAGIGWNDGLAVEDKVLGTNQINAAFDAFLSQERFDAMPAVRPFLNGLHGGTVCAVNMRAGMLRSIPGMELAKTLPSYFNADVEDAHIGQILALTTPNAIPVNIALVHEDQAVVTANYNALIEMSYAGTFFDVDAQTITPSGLAARRAGLTGQSSAVMLLAAGVMIAGAVAMVAAVSKRQQQRDGTEYVSVE